MLTISDLSNEIAGKAILKGLSLTINAGEIHAIMGPNGAGKSTLAYTLGGRPGYDVTGGSVDFDGQTCSPWTRTNARQPGCSWASSIRWKSPACPTSSSCARR
jgi:Fe-S cluster assembly ATPase SufC